MKEHFWKEVKENIFRIHKIHPPFVPTLVMRELIVAVTPFVSIFFSARILDELVTTRDAMFIGKLVLAMVGSLFVLNIIREILRFRIVLHKQIVNDVNNMLLGKKAMQLDYDLLEKQKVMDMIAKAKTASDGRLGPYCEMVVSLLGNVVSIVATIVTLGQLFVSVEVIGGEIFYGFMNSYWSTLCLFGLIGLTVWMNTRLQKGIAQLNYEQDMINVNQSRVFWAFFGMVHYYHTGKDIRIFKMHDLIRDEQAKAQGEIERIKRETLQKTTKKQSTLIVMHHLFLWVAYAFVGIKAVLGIISLGELTQYVGVILLMQGQLNGLFGTITRVDSQHTYLRQYNEYMDMRNVKYDGTLHVEKRLDNQYELEFRNVSFHYPDNDRLILKNINFKLKVGNKLAIVGPNGAGKTTFIKLLCRLYDPTEGEILLNGIDIRKYDYDEYQKLFSIVFQDYRIFAFSVGENVAVGQVYDEEQVWECLEKSGLAERVRQMPKGLDTKVLKDEHEDPEESVEISGGERQKLALARALYKNAPMVILDEPTSALDPLAEQDIYERFNEMVQDKTAIFISHRMSSCRFCKEVLVFEKGVIAQQGSHEELLADTSGLYAQMWNAQAQYYVTE